MTWVEKYVSVRVGSENGNVISITESDYCELEFTVAFPDETDDQEYTFKVDLYEAVKTIEDDLTSDVDDGIQELFTKVFDREDD